MMTHFYAGILSKVQDPTDAAKVGALLGVVFQAFVADAFAYLFVVLLVSNFLDWLFGRHAARAQKRFSNTKSRNGLVAKGAQLSVLLLLRSLEALIPLAGLPDVMGEGFGSAALALLLVVEDLESIERHSVALGSRGVPFLSVILEKIRLVTGGDRRDHQTPSIPNPGRRATDPTATTDPLHKD